MAETIASLVLIGALAYAAAGALFAAYFVVRGIGRVDHAASQSDWRFRLIILPGTIALWPVLARKLWNSTRHTSEEKAK